MKRWILLDILFLLALMVYVIAGYRKVPLHGDEPTHIYMSRDYYYLIQERDLDAVLYSESPQNPAEQELRILNGTVHKMLMGLAWDLAGLTVDDVTEQWVWEWTWDQNVALGHMPGDDLLDAARLSSVLLTAMSVILVFGITRLVTNSRLAAWAASLIYATNPAVLLNGRRAMMEGALLFFTALVVLVAVLIVREQMQQGRARIGWYVALGVVGGFAVASKHNAVVMVAAAFAAVAVVQLTARRIGLSLTSPPGPLSKQRRGAKSEPLGPLSARERGFRGEVNMDSKDLISQNPPYKSRFSNTLLKLFGAGILAILIFLALTPAWWSDPLGMPERVLDARSRLLDGQTAQAEQNGDAYNHSGDRFVGLINEAFFAGPQYYEVPVWQDYIGDQIESYEQSGLAGRGGGMVWGVLLAILVIVGMMSPIPPSPFPHSVEKGGDQVPSTTMLGRGFRGGDSPALAILIIFLITALSLLIATPFEWQRYYLLLHLPVAVIAGIGLSWAAQVVIKRGWDHVA